MMADNMSAHTTLPTAVSNIALSELLLRTWDVVIIGAGVAGSAAAVLAAQQGFATLLIESKSFPREKVCGGCLNIRAQGVLDRLGILKDLIAAGAVGIHALHLQILRTSVHWTVPMMVSVRRSTMDTMMVAKAIDAGAMYIDSATATLLAPEPQQPPGTGAPQAIASETRFVRVQKQDASVVLQSKCVLIASGLTRSGLKGLDRWPSQVESDSRIGVQCILPATQAAAYADGKLHMLVGRNGYAGLCKTDGDSVDIAAAIDPGTISTLGGIDQVIRGILEDCNAPSVDWPSASHWSATPALTRCSLSVSATRVFLIGDSIGYVEPFTGEGMAWALASAEAVMPLVSETVRGTWQDAMADRWHHWAFRQRIQKQRTCRWIAKRIRRPRGAAWVLQACNWIPPLRATIIRRTTQ